MVAEKLSLDLEDEIKYIKIDIKGNMLFLEEENIFLSKKNPIYIHYDYFLDIYKEIKSSNKKTLNLIRVLAGRFCDLAIEKAAFEDDHLLKHELIKTATRCNSAFKSKPETLIEAIYEVWFLYIINNMYSGNLKFKYDDLKRVIEEFYGFKLDFEKSDLNFKYMFNLK
ncbi:hypothetical protein [Clostridium chrysemydis]|uniref:hypothetical protein n=1 Tax=Clostridium chrysemydis TaxID=2665504 RepID=UPI0018847024|nr:hypothetical protein [Clostridium chrysemydis]